MAKSTSLTFVYRLSIFYRFALTFVLGYLCMMYLSLSLTSLFVRVLDKAEAIYLAAFIAILFYLIFIIISFCSHSLLKLTLISLGLTGVLFGISVGLN
ncbi:MULTISPECIES: hypothetical protein [Acinetobacter]|uniref:hypothetical protein n=1 Tax=Acinetobacter TaxID=469 RepID=UPI000F4EC214|nr:MULTISPECIES: hypothetical protein [Acinetobacter]MBJ8481919.1 hypothetical protein [Acinetobacter vivianii]MEB6478815.1 hypothetical protein [Acinetobacter vivianii]MEB6657354.1 hypothetical protein [Acinetobacter vivianii]RPE31493.1 hypothetical protein EC846_0960 [Acinetobacter sp. BIGb0102]